MALEVLTLMIIPGLREGLAIGFHAYRFDCIGWSSGTRDWIGCCVATSIAVHSGESFIALRTLSIAVVGTMFVDIVMVLPPAPRAPSERLQWIDIPAFDGHRDWSNPE